MIIGFVLFRKFGEAETLYRGLRRSVFSLSSPLVLCVLPSGLTRGIGCLFKKGAFVFTLPSWTDLVFFVFEERTKI